MPQVDLGFDLDKLISGNTNNNDERSLVNSSLNDSNVNREMPAMKLNLMDIMQARFNLKEVSIRNSRKMKSSLKQPNEQTNTNNEDCSNAIPLRKLSPSKTKVSNLLVEKVWDKDLNGMINQKVEALKLLPGSNANNKIQIMLEKRKTIKYLFENDPDVKVIKGDNNEYKRKNYNVDLVSIMKQSVNNNKL